MNDRIAAVNGVDLCYETFGNSGDPALLLIMGLGAHMIQWDEGFCGALAERGFLVIRFDNRDVGRSTKIETPYTLEDMASDALGLLDHLGISGAHIVGFSLGGMIAQVIALDAPERVASLTLIATRSGEPGLPPPGLEFAAIFAAPPPRDAAEYIEANVRAWKMMRPAWIDPQENERERVRAEHAAMRAPLCPEGGARQFLASANAPGRRARLSAVRAPTLVIQGEADPLCPAACGEDLARSIPGARLKLVERLGHHLPKALWPEFANAIADNARRSL